MTTTGTHKAILALAMVVAATVAGRIGGYRAPVDTARPAIVATR